MACFGTRSVRFRRPAESDQERVDLGDLFEAAVAAWGSEDGKPQTMALWVTTELLALLHRQGEGQDLRQIADIRVRPHQLADLLTALADRQINNNTAKQVLAAMMETGEAPHAIIEREGLALVSDTSMLDAAILEIFEAHPDEHARIRAGEMKLLGFFMGQVMKATRGQADPQTARARLQDLLGTGN